MLDKYLYLSIDLLSLSMPLAFSFYKKHAFYREWRFLFPAILIVAMCFIVWDVFFTHIGVWGFNDRYLVGIKLFNLPIEEILFFILIPYSSIFIYFALPYIFKFNFLERFHTYITILLLIFCYIMCIIYYDRAYTMATFSLLLVYLSTNLFFKINQANFYLAFFFIFEFFLITNGILTGSYIDDEVVWYNHTENMNIKIGTIPLEDVFYAILLIGCTINIYEFLKKKYS